MEELSPRENPIVIARTKFINLARLDVPENSALEILLNTLKNYDPQNINPEGTARILLDNQELIFSAPVFFREALYQSGLLNCNFALYEHKFELFKQAFENLNYFDALQKMINKPIAEILMAELKRNPWLLVDLKISDLENFVHKVNKLSLFDLDGFCDHIQALFKDMALNFLDKNFWQDKFAKLSRLDQKAFQAELKANLAQSKSQAASLIISYPEYFGDVLPWLSQYPVIIEKIILLRPELASVMVNARILDKIKDPEWELYLKIITENNFDRLVILLGAAKDKKEIILWVMDRAKNSPMLRQALKKADIFGDDKAFVNKMLSRLEQDFEEELDEIKHAVHPEQKLLEKMEDMYFMQELTARAEIINNPELHKVFQDFREAHKPVIAPVITASTELKYRFLSEQMSEIMRLAKLKNPELQIGRAGTVVLENPEKEKPYGTNGKIEIRFFEAGDNYHTNLDDITERINFLGRVAKRFNKISEEEIDEIIENYLSQAQKKFKDISAVQADGKKFEAMATEINIFFLELQKKLVQNIFPKQAVLSKALKEMDEMAKQVVIDEGRPTIIHIRANGSFNAQIPKGLKTYPTNYRGSDQAGVTPNSVLELAGVINADNNVKVQTSFSRASSFSVLKLKKAKQINKRQRLNYLNGLEDVKNLIRLMKPNPGEEINIHWHTLFTPLPYEKIGGSIVGLLFPSEVRQARDQHRFIELLNAQKEIEVDGEIYKININHMNTSVRDPQKVVGRADPVTQARINNKGMFNYLAQQIDAIQTAYPDLKGWLAQNCKIEMTGAMREKETELAEAYKKLYLALGIEDESQQNPALAKAARKEIKELEEALMKLYERALEKVKDNWANNPPVLPDKYQHNAHLMYFADVLNLYFSGRYMSAKGYPYLLVSEMHRTNDFADLITAVNCKSAKDRTKDAVDHVRMLLMYENQNPGKFLLSTNPETREYIRQNYQNIRRQGVGLAATGKNLPGARGSRSNNPWGDDKFKTDSLVSAWGVIKATICQIIRYWLNMKLNLFPRSEAVYELLVETHDPDPRIYNMSLLKNLKNKTLAVAMVNLLTLKGLKISEDPKAVQKAVTEINKEILSDAVMPKDFLQKYNKFLKILAKHKISAINDIRGEFIVAIVTGNQNLEIKSLDEKSDYIEVREQFDQLKKHCMHLDYAIQKLPGLIPDSSVEMAALIAQRDKFKPEQERLAKLMAAMNPRGFMEPVEKPEKRADLRFSVPLASGLADKSTKANKSNITVIAYYPDKINPKEKFSDEIQDADQIQKLKDAGEHLIEMTDRQVSYTAPKEKPALLGSELEILVDKMLDEVLKKCASPTDRENIKLSGKDAEMVKLAKIRLPLRIAVLEEKELHEKLSRTRTG